MSIIGHRHIIEACKKYTEKCVNLQQNSPNWPNGPKFRVVYAKKYTGSTKVHHHWFCDWNLYQLCRKKVSTISLGSPFCQVCIVPHSFYASDWALMAKSGIDFKFMCFFSVYVDAECILPQSLIKEKSVCTKWCK